MPRLRARVVPESKRKAPKSVKSNGKKKKEEDQPEEETKQTETVEEQSNNDDGNQPDTTSNKKHKDLAQVFEDTKVQEVLPWMKDGKPIELTVKDSFYQALTTLLDNRILSAPIKDEKGKYIGFIDTVDLVAATVEIGESCDTFRKENQDGNNEDDEDQDLIEENLIVDQLGAKSLVDYSKHDHFEVVNESAPLKDVVNHLSQANCHRVAVRSDEDSNKFLGIISQSGFCEYLIEEHALLMNDFDHKVKEINGGSHPHREIFSVTNDSKTYDALKLMRTKGVSGLAVVNESGVLVDVFSSSDLTLWTEWRTSGEVFRFRDFTSLRKTVKEFLENSRAQRNIEKTGPVVCESSMRVVDCLSKMLENNVHRLFLLDDSGKPQNVVTYGDILKYLGAQATNKKSKAK